MTPTEWSSTVGAQHKRQPQLWMTVRRTATRYPSEHPDRSRAYRMRLDFAVVGQAGRRACTEDLCTAYEQVSGKTEIARTFSKALGQGAREAFELTACSHGATGLSQPTAAYCFV